MLLDPLIQSAKSGDTINLGPGVWYTDGCDGYATPTGPLIPPNVKIVGAGQNKTFIRFNRKDLQNRQWIVLYGRGGGISVSDVTVDCGFPPANWILKICGIYLEGDNNTIQRSTVLRPYGSIAGGAECFAIKCAFGKNCLVDSCTVAGIDPNSDYISAVGVHGGVVSRSAVFFPIRASGKYPYWHGINCEGVGSAVEVYDNIVIGAKAGYYLDTGAVTGLNFHHNTLTDVLYGISINIQYVGVANRSIANSKFNYNNIVLDGSWGDISPVIIDHTVQPYNPNGVCNGNFAQNISFVGNTFEVVGAPYKTLQMNIASQATSSGVSATNGISGISFVDNVYPSGMDWRNMGNKAVDLKVYNALPINWNPL